jgi:hypothetical protein
MARFDFPKEKGLQTYSAVYVPSTKGVNKKITQSEFNKRISETQKFLSKEFGGATADKRKGLFKTRGGKIVKEDVAVVENYSTFSDWKKHDQTIRKFLKKKAKKWGQESIAMEFEAPNKQRRMIFVKNKLAKVA